MKTICLALSLLGLITIGSAQSSTNTGEIKPQSHNFLFGFSFGANYTQLNSKSDLPTNTNVLNGIGARLGVNGEYVHSSFFQLRLSSELVFNSSRVNFSNGNNEVVDHYHTKPVSIDIMGHVKFQNGLGKDDVYVLLGPSVSIPLNKNNLTTADYPTNIGLNADVGCGYNINLKNFSVAPEIRFSYGLNDINAHPQLTKLYSNSLIFSLIFKG